MPINDPFFAKDDGVAATYEFDYGELGFVVVLFTNEGNHDVR